VRIVEQSRQGDPQRVFISAKAFLEVQDSGFDASKRRLVLQLDDVKVRDLPSGPRENHRSSVTVANLEPLPLDPTVTREIEDDGAAMLTHAKEVADEAPRVERALRLMDRATSNLHGQVVSRLWRRWAMALSAGLLPLLGAVLALNMRHAQPLSIYLVAFIPSLLNLVLISGGSSFMRQGDEVGGWLVLWSGNLVLAGIIAVGWHRLGRH
jgi:lipopolysaccharide export LptBFGC system permease protein LptF